MFKSCIYTHVHVQQLTHLGLMNAAA